MKVRIKLDSLTLIGTRKNYSVQFKDGFNLISGPTSTGKTSILGQHRTKSARNGRM